MVCSADAAEPGKHGDFGANKMNPADDVENQKKKTDTKIDDVSTRLKSETALIPIEIYAGKADILKPSPDQILRIPERYTTKLYKYADVTTGATYQQRCGRPLPSINQHGFAEAGSKKFTASSMNWMST